MKVLSRVQWEEGEWEGLSVAAAGAQRQLGQNLYPNI